MAGEMSRRSFIAPVNEFDDAENRIAARYRSELKAEIQLREDAEKRAQESEQQRDAALKQVEPLAAERQARAAAEKREQESLKREQETTIRHAAEISALHSDMEQLRGQLPQYEYVVQEVARLRQTVSKLEGVPSQVLSQLAEFDKKLVKPAREVLHLPNKEPVPAFDFKPTYDMDGRIVGLRATPIKVN